MANTKITELTALTQCAATDVLPIVKVSANTTKKVSISDLLRNAPAGTAGAPGIANADDQDTGILFPAANSVAVSTGGAQRLVIDSSGNVGIGTTSVSNELHLKKTGANAFIRIENTGNGNHSGIFFVRESSAGTSKGAANIHVESNTSSTSTALVFGCGSNTNTTAGEKMRIDSSGRLLVGTTTPSGSSNLQVAGKIATLGLDTAFGTDSVPTIYRSGSTAGSYPFDNFGHLIIQPRADGAPRDIIFATGNGGTNKTVIDSSGNVGIGTSSPARELEVASSSAQIRITDSDSASSGNCTLEFAFSGGRNGYVGYGGSNALYLWNELNNNLIFGTNNTERMRIDSSGNVGIGTTSPQAISGYTVLTLNNATQGGAIEFKRNGTSYGRLLQGSSAVILETKQDIPLVFGTGTSATERMRIDSSGRLLVGITSNYASGNADDLVIGSSSSSTERGITLGSTVASAIRFADAGNASAGMIQYVHNSGGTDYMNFYTAATERMRIDSSGNVCIGKTSADALLDVNGQARFGGNKVTLDTDGSISGTISNSTTRAFVLSNTNVNADYFGGRVIQVGPDGTVNIGGSAGTSPSSYSSPNIKLNPAGSSYINGGNVGIGTSSPTDSNGFGRCIDIRSSTGAAIYLRDSDDTSNDTFAIGRDNTTSYLITNSGNLMFSVAGSERMRIDSSGRLLVGTTSAPTGGDWAQYSKAIFTGSTGSTADAGTISLKRGGTAANGNPLGVLSFSDSNGGEFAYIKCEADGTTGSSDYPGRLVFSTTADGASSPTERMRIANDGFTSIYTNTSAAIRTNRTSSSETAFFVANGATGTLNGTIKFKVMADGDVENTNNSYGAISDAKLKENIVDASSQWDDIKDLRVRNYNFIEGHTHTQIGVVAQEVETVSPGLVSETPDTDEEGNDLGTVTKSVNYSVLYMKAVKALQEAMDRIETLEAKVAALEAQ